MRDAIEKFIFGLEKSDTVRVDIVVTKDQLNMLGLDKIRELSNTLINREYEKRNNLGVQNKSKARS
jgi:hypothetical protein